MLGDGQGRAIHLGERDCSLQRRHQKVWEESPSPALNDTQRGEIGDFRFAGAVLHDRFAIGKRGGHEQVFSAGDGNFVEDNFRATQATAF